MVIIFAKFPFQKCVRLFNLVSIAYIIQKTTIFVVQKNNFVVVVFFTIAILAITALLLLRYSNYGGGFLQLIICLVCCYCYHRVCVVSFVVCLCVFRLLLHQVLVPGTVLLSQKTRHKTRQSTFYSAENLATWHFTWHRHFTWHKTRHRHLTRFFFALRAKCRDITGDHQNPGSPRTWFYFSGRTRILPIARYISAFRAQCKKKAE